MFIPDSELVQHPYSQPVARVDPPLRSIYYPQFPQNSLAYALGTNESRPVVGAHSPVYASSGSYRHSDPGLDGSPTGEAMHATSQPSIYDQGHQGSSPMAIPAGNKFHEFESAQLPFHPHPAENRWPVAASLNSTPEDASSDISSHSPLPPNVEGESSSAAEPDDAQEERLSPRRTTIRKKPHIELAPGQPLTTLGKARERVFVACISCRDRKIRCDGAKPACYNCKRRGEGAKECSYDPLPRRRGPDKSPGMRQRTRAGIDYDMNIPRQRRMRTGGHRNTMPTNTVESIHTLKSASSEELLPWQDRETPSQGESSSSASLHSRWSHHDPDVEQLYFRGTTCGESFVQEASAASTHYVGVMPDATDEYYWKRNALQIAAQPSLNYTRKTWWDSLLALYSAPFSRYMVTLTPSQRESAARGITSDLRFVFRVSNYWFSFFHIPSFFGTYCDPVKREEMQPSLLLSLLAISTFWQSSEIGKGKDGRERAMRFREEAQCALDASFNSNAINETLAQAAWLLAIFEVCAHPYHSTSRSTSAMMVLDSMIRALALTRIDAGDPRSSSFRPRKVPIVRTKSSDHDVQTSQRSPRHHLSTRSSVLPDPSNQYPKGCSCADKTLGSRWPQALVQTPLWVSTPSWDPAWSDAEIRKESCRRLCWSSTTLAAGHVSYAAVSKTSKMDLFIADPANYTLLFSGESVIRSPSALSSTSCSKDSVWALHDRAFLLWHACMKLRNDPDATDNDKAQFGVQAWLEAEALEAALDRHTCGIERAFIYHGREYLFNTRMAISYEFQRYIPLVTANLSGLFHRVKAEEWLSRQAVIASQFMYGLSAVTGNPQNVLALRPFFVFWFMGQVSRALSLWTCDKTMTIALDVCKAFLAPIDYLAALWPCEEQRQRYERLRERLNFECVSAGLPPVPPANFTLPPPRNVL